MEHTFLNLNDRKSQLQPNLPSLLSFSYRFRQEIKTRKKPNEENIELLLQGKHFSKIKLNHFQPKKSSAKRNYEA